MTMIWPPTRCGRHSTRSLFSAARPPRVFHSQPARRNPLLAITSHGMGAACFWGGMLAADVLRFPVYSLPAEASAAPVKLLEKRSRLLDVTWGHPHPGTDARRSCEDTPGSPHSSMRNSWRLNGFASPSFPSAAARHRSAHSRVRARRGHPGRLRLVPLLPQREAARTGGD